MRVALFSTSGMNRYHSQVSTRVPGTERRPPDFHTECLYTLSHRVGLLISILFLSRPKESLKNHCNYFIYFKIDSGGDQRTSISKESLWGQAICNQMRVSTGILRESGRVKSQLQWRPRQDTEDARDREHLPREATGSQRAKLRGKPGRLQTGRMWSGHLSPWC